MRAIKKILLRILPIVFTAIIATVMMASIYSSVIKTEIEECWERLDEGANYMSDNIGHTFADNLNLLERVADAIVMKEDMQSKEKALEYIRSVRKNTIFGRIDILYPDSSLISEDGVPYPRFDGQMPFSELEKKGAHISGRYTDHNFNEEVIYFTAPIVRNGETTALLIGVIGCNDLKDIFSLHIYSRRAQMFLIDRTDGKFLIDNWHEHPSNLSEIGNLEKLDGYENVDFQSDIKNGNSGRLAFISAVNGEASYMSYAPIDEFGWTMAVMVQKNVAMESVVELNRSMMIAGIIMLVFILVYVAWNVSILSKSVKNEEIAHKAELEKEKNMAKSRFLSTMSHDLRTPLNGIVGMLDIIEKYGDDPEKINDCLSKIRISANYLTTLANDVLDINELESGKLLIQKRSFDVLELIEKVNVIVTPMATDASIGYHVDVSHIRHPYVVGSEAHIQRVLVNLISNAIKYNKPQGDVWLSVDEASDVSGRSYRFTVRDSGIGMSKEFQNTMFEAFEQENSGARTTHSGHGLGLTIVQNLVQKMNGRIEVDSQVGKGTTFVVIIPLERDIMNAEKAEGLEVTSDDPKELRQMRILLVEDNELNMEIARVILSESGAEILTAYNGRQALEIFSASEEGSIDVILMDVMMPEMDGLEATRAIRKTDREDARTVPIIAMTASTFEDDVRRYINSGMNDHIGKPIDIGTLLELISKYKK